MTKPSVSIPEILLDFEPPRDSMPIKWGSVTQVLPRRPASWGDVASRVCHFDVDPQPNDVIVGQVVEINRHTRLEIDSGRKVKLYRGDLVGMAFGNRYATRQYHGLVPGASDHYDILSQGGVCGRVVSAPIAMKDPSIVRPLGFLVGDTGEIVNLRAYGLQMTPQAPRVPVIVVVGSSMDAGKTTMASGIVRGLSNAGQRVNAAKITGTGCVKDIHRMEDAGAERVLDFNHAGFASTFQCREDEIQGLCDTLLSNLAADNPDYIVVEIADGLVQRETKFVLNYLSSQSRIDYLGLAVHDVMAAPACVEYLRQNWDIEVTAISGVATITPLSTAELSESVSVPCLTDDELADEGVLALFPKLGSAAPLAAGVAF